MCQIFGPPCMPLSCWCISVVCSKIPSKSILVTASPEKKNRIVKFSNEIGERMRPHSGTFDVGSVLLLKVKTKDNEKQRTAVAVRRIILKFGMNRKTDHWSGTKALKAFQLRS